MSIVEDAIKKTGQIINQVNNKTTDQTSNQTENQVNEITESPTQAFGDGYIANDNNYYDMLKNPDKYSFSEVKPGFQDQFNDILSSLDADGRKYGGHSSDVNDIPKEQIKREFQPADDALNPSVTNEGSQRYYWDEASNSLRDRNFDLPQANQNEVTEKRMNNGEDMFVPAAGSYVKSEYQGRVYDGTARNASGQNDVINNSVSQNYGIDPIGGVLNNVSEGINGIQNTIFNGRKNFTDAALDSIYGTEKEFVVSDGTRYDFDSIISPELDSYMENSQSETGRYQKEAPEDLKNGQGYSSITGLVYAVDDSGNYITDENGQNVAVDIDKFYPQEDELVTDVYTGKLMVRYDIPKELINFEKGYYELNDGTKIPVTKAINSNGEEIVAPAIYVGGGELADNPDDAVVWYTQDPLTLSDGTVVPFTDVNQIVGNKAERVRKHNQAGGNGLRDTPIADFLEFMNKDVEVNEDGMIASPEDWVRAGVDGIISTIPYMFKPIGFPMAINDVYVASKGLDPSTYDPATGTYADPGSMSEEERRGLLVKTTAEYMLDYLIGGKLAELGSKGFKTLFPGNKAASTGLISSKAMKDMSKPLGYRLGKAGIYEGGQEALSGLFSDADRGALEYWFADQAVDENGNLVYDEEGNPVYNRDTEIGHRWKNLMNEEIPNFLIGGAAGSLLATPGSIQQRNADKATLSELNGLVPHYDTNAQRRLSDRNRAILDRIVEDEMKNRL